MSSSPWNHFTLEELRCPHCGEMHMNDLFMKKIVALREVTEITMPVTSGYRCIYYDNEIGGAGVHPTGHGLDIQLSGSNADKIITLAPAFGMTGRGIDQKGAWDQRFIHLDDLEDGEHLGKYHPRPRTWTY